GEKLKVGIKNNISTNFFFLISGDHRDIHSYPTRRSSDLSAQRRAERAPLDGRGPAPVRDLSGALSRPARAPDRSRTGAGPRPSRDRKSTRLNSSHDQISYAVFCLKKKTDVSI